MGVTMMLRLSILLLMSYTVTLFGVGPVAPNSDANWLTAAPTLNLFGDVEDSDPNWDKISAPTPSYGYNPSQTAKDPFSMPDLGFPDEDVESSSSPYSPY